MKYHISLFVLSLLWCGVFSDFSCRTPQDRLSKCVSLNDCPDLILEFQKRPSNTAIANYVTLSTCGFEGYTPKVCCGPLPDKLLQTTPTNQKSELIKWPLQKRNPKVHPWVDYVFEEDSYLTARNKCGMSTIADRIYGGVMTELDEFPWMALLGYKNSSSSIFTYQCGGALINRRYVLTAAHCVERDYQTKHGKLTTVRLGEYDLQTEVDCSDGVCAEPVQEYAVQSAHPHPGFSDKKTNRKHDIALLRLAKRVKLLFNVQPICLMDRGLSLDTGNEVHVAGWGRTYGVTNKTVKQKLSLPIFSKSECVQKYKKVKIELTDDHLCAGGVFSEDACFGDSGGPLMRLLPSGIWEVLAVVSFGNGCGREGWPGVYSSIANYSKWIQKTVRYTNEINSKLSEELVV